MFCVECGKEGSVFKNGLCLECFIKNTNFSETPSIVAIIECPKCGAFKYKNIWTTDPYKYHILRVIKTMVNINPLLSDITYDLSCDPYSSQFFCQLRITGFLQGVEIIETHQIQVRVTRNVCDVCSKAFGGYYESILQIRATDRKLDIKEQRAIECFIEEYIADEQGKGNRGLFITDRVKEHTGFDFYLSERSLAYSLARKLQNRYGGEIKQSKSTVGMKDGHVISRVTVLFRLPAFQIGDFISIKKDTYYIAYISGLKVHVIHLDSWQESTEDIRDLKNIHVYPSKDFIQKMIVVSQSPTEVQVMHPETYTTYQLRKPKPIDIQSETIPVVRIHETLFLVPEKKEKSG